MALETPNRLAASIVFYFAEIDAQPPGLDNPFTLTISAIEGVNSLETVTPDTLADGFFLELHDKITPDVGCFFASGTFEQDAPFAGFTPFAQLPGGAADAFAQTEGNFLMQADLDTLYGMLSVACWTVTPTDAELPVEIPVA